MRTFRHFFLALLGAAGITNAAWAQHSSVFFPSRRPVWVEQAPAYCPPFGSSSPYTIVPPQYAPPANPEMMPTPTPSTTPSDPTTTPNPTTPSTDPSTSQAPTPSFGNEAGAANVDVAGLNTPNIMGNFLGTYKSISFPLNNTGGSGFGTAGATTVSNAKIADNNSPIPRDRVGYRYNFFSNANRIAGIGPLPDSVVNGAAYLEPTYTRNYDTHLNGFEFEKTFFDGYASIDVRLPIVTTASSRQDLTFAVPGAPFVLQNAFGGIPAGADVFKGVRTADKSLGKYGTEFGNMQVIFKSILFRTDDFLLSGGLGIGVPTGSDMNVTVRDLYGTARLDPPPPPVGFPQNDAFGARTRNFYIKNETWGLSPFLAYVYAPRGSRWFTQGFLEAETPLNASTGRFQESVVFSDPNLAPLFPGQKIDQAFNVREPMLVHVSTNTGFWLVQNPCATWLRGIAPTVELHLTQSATKGYATTLQSDGVGVFNSRTGVFTPPAPTTVGHAGNITFLDVTLGTTFWVGDGLTVATGVALPLLSGDNHRSYDAEFQLQVNWFFGPGGFASRPVPNLN